MHIVLIAAMDQKRAIGNKNQLLWHLPKDLQHFKQQTWALPVVMGRKTFESLSGKPLNGRMNIVVTRQKDWQAAGVHVAHSLEEALAMAQEADYKKACVVGGGEIYAAALPLAHELCLTRVEADLPADSFFPEWNAQDWVLHDETKTVADAKNPYAMAFQTWLRA